MIKPIVYHDFDEKELLEKKLMAVIPQEKSQSALEALMNIFRSLRGKRKVTPNQNRNDKSRGPTVPRQGMHNPQFS